MLHINIKCVLNIIFMKEKTIYVVDGFLCCEKTF